MPKYVVTTDRLEGHGIQNLNKNFIKMNYLHLNDLNDDNKSKFNYKRVKFSTRKMWFYYKRNLTEMELLNRTLCKDI